MTALIWIVGFVLVGMAAIALGVIIAAARDRHETDR